MLLGSIASSIGISNILHSCIYIAVESPYFFIRNYGEAFLMYNLFFVYYNYCVIAKNTAVFAFNIFEESRSLNCPSYKSGLDEFSYYIDLGYF
jgi:hypothetical protein